ncbi:MAG: Fis family transcriptional regulator [Myxococcaceae bacterium]
MDRATYPEAELVQNRASVLLFGGTAEERKAWAEEAASRLGRTLTVVGPSVALAEALTLKDGVVFLEEVLALGEGAQQQLVRCLQTQEERPKVVVGVRQGAEAVEGLRPDLHYVLRLAQVNLDEPGLRDTLAKRRARRLPVSTEGPAAGRPRVRAAMARPAPPRRPAPAKKRGKRSKPRATAKRSRR